MTRPTRNCARAMCAARRKDDRPEFVFVEESMTEIRQNIKPALTREYLAANNANRIFPAYARENVVKINLGKQTSLPPADQTAGHIPSAPGQSCPPAVQPPALQPVREPPVTPMRIPDLYCSAGRGQKTMLGLSAGCGDKLSVCFGWNVKDRRCDLDASAFLLTEGGRVPGDDWFVFYSQTESPDRSVAFSANGREDREIIKIDFSRLNPGIKKIVFVLTINEAFENQLNFSMIQDAYVRVLNTGTGQEIVSFMVSEYYSNVTSMTICEIYLHNGQWKFNPVGNGVQKDLAGQCLIYGVDIG